MTENAQLMTHLLGLPARTMITTGRVGTDFVQSLFDSHPQVLTFNGHLQFYPFWRSSACVAAGSLDAADFLDEFIGAHIMRFKSRYDLIERKDQLGEAGDQYIDIDTAHFKALALNLLEGFPVDAKHMMLAIYGAYAQCLGQDLWQKKLFFHHEHHVGGLAGFLKDFPQAKIICMTRDPRANFVSGIENHRRYDKTKDNGRHLFNYIERIIIDARVLDVFPNEHVSLKLEDMGDKAVVLALCTWMGVDYHPCMQESTWGGLRWYGDRVSKDKVKEKGFSKNILKNNWESRLSATDQYVLNFIMRPRLLHYGYPCPSLKPWDIILVPLIAILPLWYEWHYFSPGYILDLLRRGQAKRIVSNAIFYFKRVILFLKHYVRVAAGEKFTAAFIKA